MANPLQPKVIKCLEKEYKAYAINIVAASKAGTMDVIACVPREFNLLRYKNYGTILSLGMFYGFEVKYKNDQPSELQKQKINKCIEAGGRAYFIRSVEQLRDILDNNRAPIKYQLKNNLVL